MLGVKPYLSSNLFLTTIRLFNIAMEVLNGRIIYKWAIFHGYVK